jgi:hypothetical protein
MTEETRDPELKQLREEWEAPAPRGDLHQRILMAYVREFRGARAWRRYFTVRANLFTAASAVFVTALLLVFVHGGGKESPAPVHVMVPPVPLAIQTVQTGGPPKKPSIVRNSQRTKSFRRTLPRVASTSEQALTQFFSLMDAPPPLGRGALLRARVPVSMMRAVGLPVREERLNDTVQADILVGEEGLPHAIRFVGADQ